MITISISLLYAIGAIGLIILAAIVAVAIPLMEPSIRRVILRVLTPVPPRDAGTAGESPRKRPGAAPDASSPSTSRSTAFVP